MDRLVLLLCCALGCGRSHPSPNADGGSDVLEPCPDFSCEARCAGISVCDCTTLDGEALCESILYGRCVEGECVTGGTDAGIVDDIDAAGPVDAGVDTGPIEPTSGVPCGGVSCESPIAVCVICPHEDFTDTHCLPADFEEEGWPFRTAMESHPFCGFPGLFIQCDGPEDCSREDQECVFNGGEWGYAQCMNPTDGAFGIACRSDSDCEPGARCGEIDPFGYFSPYFEQLGWRPYACGGASAQASAFCDEWDLGCAGSPGFYDRSQCLQAYDSTWDEDDVECARAHIARDACADAAASSPCEA